MIWGSWLAAVALSFGSLEAYCLYEGVPTLSEFVRTTLTTMWPGMEFFFGVATALLAVHFWNQNKKDN